MDVPFLDLKEQTNKIQNELLEEIKIVINSSSFVLSDKVMRFENDLKSFLKCKQVISVSNGLDALRLALMSIGIAPNDEVIVPANSFIATALAVSSLGAKVKLVDCDEENYNLDPKLLSNTISRFTKAIIPVHLAGQSSPMGEIMQIASNYKLYVIEDAAQSIGAKYKNLQTGTVGDIGCFSFYPGKNLGAFGDGGAICTNNESLAEKVRILRNYGQVKKYHHVLQGLNCRLDELQAAILSVKLKYLESWNNQRRKNAALYQKLLANLPQITIKKTLPYSSHNYHLFIIEAELRDRLKAFLTKNNIVTQIHYPIPIHLQKAYKSLKYAKGDFPMAEKLADRILSLPMYPEISEDQIFFVCEKISAFYETKI